MPQEGKRYPKRGFASIDKERQKEIASLGGKASQEKRRGHRWTPEEARAFSQMSVEKRANKPNEVL